MKTTKPPAWYRVAHWAKQGQWELVCRGIEHLSFEKGPDFMEVSLQAGRFVTAHYHRHLNEKCEIIGDTEDADEAHKWLVEGP